MAENLVALSGSWLVERKADHLAEQMADQMAYYWVESLVA
jgi:hypothetical protein